MKKTLAVALLLLGSTAQAKNYWGFELSTGPGYRQDRVEWGFSSNKEVYPHLRMFDWAVSFDANLGKVHLIGEGDRGWFSSQTMRKNVNISLPTSFSFAASGKATTTLLCLGYELGSRNTMSLMPMMGWMYDSTVLHLSNPIPPFNQLTQNIPASFVFADASIEMLSNLRQKWQGAMLGAQLSFQLLRGWFFEGSYAYGWLYFNQSFSETETILYYLPGPVAATQSQKTIQGDTSGGGGHGNLGKFKTMIFLSKSLSLDLGFRYFSLVSGKISTSIQGADQKVDAKVSSATFTAELSYRF